MASADPLNGKTQNPQPDSTRSASEDIKARASDRQWGPAKTKGHELLVGDLAALGERVATTAQVPEGGLSQEQIAQMAKELLRQNEEARRIANRMDKKGVASVVLGGTAKSSGSFIKGGAEGAALAAGVLALSYPIRWGWDKLRGKETRTSIIPKQPIVIGAIAVGAYHVFKSLKGSYLEPLAHNADMKAISQKALEEGISRGLQKRGFGQASGPAPQGPGSSDNKGPDGPMPDGSPSVDTAPSSPNTGNVAPISAGIKPQHEALVASIAEGMRSAAATNNLTLAAQDVPAGEQITTGLSDEDRQTKLTAGRG